MTTCVITDEILRILPPSLPHAVFTPENYLAVGDQVCTKGNLAQSIDGLRVVERSSNVSNEDLDESVSTNCQAVNSRSSFSLRIP